MQLVEHRFQFGANISQASSRHYSSACLQDGANELNELYGQDLRAIAPVLGMWNAAGMVMSWTGSSGTWDLGRTDWKCRGIGAQLLRSRCLGDAELGDLCDLVFPDSHESHKFCQGMGWHPGAGVGANLDGESDSLTGVEQCRCTGHFLDLVWKLSIRSDNWDPKTPMASHHFSPVALPYWVRIIFGQHMRHISQDVLDDTDVRDGNRQHVC